jgi:hypothetical protein
MSKKSVNKRFMIRQGDVMLVPFEGTLPEDATKEKDTVLAHGEAHGHYHRTATPDSAIFNFMQNGEEVRVLNLPTPAKLLHEEHDPIELPAGGYKIIRQRTFQRGVVRNVLD